MPPCSRSIIIIIIKHAEIFIENSASSISIEFEYKHLKKPCYKSKSLLQLFTGQIHTDVRRIYLSQPTITLGKRVKASFRMQIATFLSVCRYEHIRRGRDGCGEREMEGGADLDEIHMEKRVIGLQSKCKYRRHNASATQILRERENVLYFVQKLHASTRDDDYMKSTQLISP